MSQIDFLPPHYRLTQARTRRVVREVLLLVGVAMVIAGWYLVARHHLTALERQARAAQEEALANQGLVAEKVNLEAQRQDLLRRTYVERRLTPSIDLAPVIATLAQLMPPAVAANSLSVTFPRPTPAQGGAAAPSLPPTSPPLCIEMTGLAPTDMEIADFVGKLTGHPLFDNVKMDYSRAVQVGDVKGRAFRVEVEVPMDRDYKPARLAVEAPHED